ncbi:anti-sigma-K factor RskA [Acidovorax soli]|uniref:Anti-sigma-K factor RskA n=1 Tax=Acidovorax soli TaxID=592050 RepID=A0A7X0PBX2_9BURK|nr:anti-sigma factor [Acidovorax soli]MBB6559073.1 anti-sigma-K factor RskA [Acidovorax soli]
MNYLLPERLDRLAREYALGTLAGPARRRFERVLQSSPAAVQAVDAWRRRLAVLDLSTVPRQPPAATWYRIEQRLFGAPPPTHAAAATTSAWQRLLQALKGLLSGRTLSGALAGLLLCALLVRGAPGLLGLEPRADALPASYVGLLLDAGGKPTLVASSRRQGRQLTVKLLQPLAVPAGQVAQLWALPKDGGAPVAVGVVPASGSARIALPDTSEKLFFTVSQLAVSFEPAPAQAGGAPSGPFALIGHCVKVW